MSVTETRTRAEIQSACLECMKSWVPSPAWHKPDVVYNPSTSISLAVARQGRGYRGRRKSSRLSLVTSEFKTSLDYTTLSETKGKQMVRAGEC